MLADARPALLLTQERLGQRIVDAGALQTLCLDRDWETIGKQPETNLQTDRLGEEFRLRDLHLRFDGQAEGSDGHTSSPDEFFAVNDKHPGNRAK